MEIKEIVFVHRSNGALVETNYRLSDGTSVRLMHGPNNEVAPDMHIRFRPEGAAIDHMTAVPMTNPDPMWDPVAAECLTAEHGAFLGEIGAAHVAANYRPLAFIAAQAVMPAVDAPQE